MSFQRFAAPRWGLSRRKLIKGAAAGAAAASLGWLGGQAPARAQTRTIHLLLNTNFRPPIDVEMQALAKDFQKLTGTAVETEFIAGNSITPRIFAALEMGKGADVFLVQWNQAHLFDKGLADVGDLVAEAGGERIYAYSREAVRVNGVYRAVPWYLLCSAMTYNVPVCEKLGITKYPDTYDELMIAGKKMKDAGSPVGWCLGRTAGDGAFGNYPIFWSFGAAEVDEKGRVILNSKEGRLAVEYMRQFWHDCCDETGMGWTDANNNQAFLARQCACVLNAASIYLKARVDKDPIADQIRHTVAPAGPAGRFHLNYPFNLAIGAYSKQQAPAREFVRYLMAKPQYERVFAAAGGFIQGPTPEWENHALWKADPIVAPFAHLVRYGRNMGFRGPFNRASADVQNKYIIADTFARGINEGTDAALQWAEKELQQIYKRTA